MPTVIDSLLVTLGLENRQFKKGTDEVNSKLKDTGKQAEKTGKQLNQAGKDGAKGANEAKQAWANFMTLMATGYLVKKFVTDLVQTNAELYRFSRNLGESTQRVSAFSNAVEITGGSAQAFRGTLDMLSRSQTELQMTGQSSLIPYFSRMGISMLDANGKMKSTTKTLMEITDYVEKSGMQRPQAYNFLRSMGIDEGTANAMLEGRKSLEQLIAQQEKHGALTDKQGSQAEATRRSIAETTIQMRAASNEMVDHLAPALKTILDLFNKVNAATDGWGATLITVAGSVGVLTAAIKALAGAFAFLIGSGATAGGVEAGAGAAAGGFFARFTRLLKWGGGLGALLYSEDLNPGEDEWAARQRANRHKPGVKPTVQVDNSPPPNPDNSIADRHRFIAEASRRLGVPKQIIDAQLRLETGPIGNKAIGHYNYGNIKSGSGWKGPVVSRNVTEYGPNGAYNVRSGFRSYGSPEEAARDYADLISRRYPGAKGAKTAEEYSAALQAGGYATDPQYAAKVSRITRGIPGASGFASAATAPGQTIVTGNNSTVSIGEINIVTQAKDAKEVAQNIGGEINSLFPSYGNRGLF